MLRLSLAAGRWAAEQPGGMIVGGAVMHRTRQKVPGSAVLEDQGCSGWVGGSVGGTAHKAAGWFVCWRTLCQEEEGGEDAFSCSGKPSFLQKVSSSFLLAASVPAHKPDGGLSRRPSRRRAFAIQDAQTFPPTWGDLRLERWKIWYL